TRGRIFRLAPKGHKYQVARVDLESKDGMLAALGSPNLAVRYVAMAKLYAGSPKVAIEVVQSAITQTDNAWLRARGIWQVTRLFPWQKWKSDAAQMARQEPDERFRRQAYRILAASSGVTDELGGRPRTGSGAAETLAKESAPAVLSEALSWL